jgi:pimeloyl-ACP methyl ester carboxylesterase
MNLSVPVGGGVTLHVRHRPGTVSPAFLLVHGLASNARLWDEVADRLATAGHAVYAVDLRGHGESDAPDTGYDTATAAADLAAVGTALGLTGAIIAGHSWGADVALCLAAGHPALVAGLALVDGGYTDATVVYESWEQVVALSQSQPDLDRATIEDIRDYLRAIHPDWSTRAIEAWLFSLRVNPDGSLSPLPSVQQRTAVMRSVWDDPPAQWYSAITVPVLLMPAIPRVNVQLPNGLGSLSDRLRSSIETAAALLPHATIRQYPDSDHELHAQHPGRVADDLLQLAHTAQDRIALDDPRHQPTWFGE